jgi:hypothetical protein
MRGTTLFCLLTLLFSRLYAQTPITYTITADSVLLTSCDSSELIIQNHTQNVPGFLFNTGNGRTIFKHGLQPLPNGSYLIGADTLNLSNSWLQGGNRFGTTGILGTLDNNPLDLYSNGSQRLRFTPTGRMLFGTTADNGTNTFQFNGSIYDTLGFFTNFTSPFIGSNNSGALRLRWGGGDGVYIGFFYQGNANRRAFMATPADSRPFILQDQVGVSFLSSPYVAVGEEGSLGSKFNVYNPNNSLNDMTLVRVNPSDSLVFDLVVNSTGHVVLNGGFLSDDGNELQVHGTSDFTGPIGLGTPYPTAQLHTTGSVRFAGLTQDSTQTKVLVTDANGNVYYRSASSLAAEDLVRSSLAVNGTIKSKKIILSPDDWADYVFDSTYRLPGLGEVESYIRREHHLPGIPSAAAVQKDSLDVGASQAALLKKIEELTLYTIEQKKEMDSMKARMEKLEKLLADKIKDR